ncbi:MAG: class I SAM-dependent methyltransferase [Patescibacteria group bacterium]|jgi:SAM-dependent methyltransferase
MNTYLKKFIDVKFKKPGKALDLGAGDFSDITDLKKLGWEGEGVDIKTGVDLEKPYQSKNKPFDLVYTNYVLQKLKNKEQLIKTAYSNLKNSGWFFIHTFDKSDPNGKSDITADFLEKLLKKQGFKNIAVKIFDFYDDEAGHKHWHKILEAKARK